MKIKESEPAKVQTIVRKLTEIKICTQYSVIETTGACMLTIIRNDTKQKIPANDIMLGDIIIAMKH